MLALIALSLFSLALANSFSLVDKSLLALSNAICATLTADWASVSLFWACTAFWARLDKSLRSCESLSWTVLIALSCFVKAVWACLIWLGIADNTLFSWAISFCTAFWLIRFWLILPNWLVTSLSAADFCAVTVLTKSCASVSFLLAVANAICKSLSLLLAALIFSWIPLRMFWLEITSAFALSNASLLLSALALAGAKLLSKKLVSLFCISVMTFWLLEIA